MIEHNEIFIEKRKPGNILITGGCGFIGSNFIQYLFNRNDFDGKIVNVDKLTYAGNPENLNNIDEKHGGERYFFERGDICDSQKMEDIFRQYNIDTIIHFAAESHVDRSILGPGEFIQTNIIGTFNLLEMARKYWLNPTNSQIRNPSAQYLFHHISTDEVYGSLGETGYFYEYTPYDPRSPYSASKASSDHLVRAYFHTFGLPITLSNCSNNYGPYQFPEKLIPLMILNAMEGKPLPVYGDGKNVRDWLYVEDHCSAIRAVIYKGKVGETYNIGGESEETNINVVSKICEILEKLYPIKQNKLIRNHYSANHHSLSPGQKYNDLINFVKDRPGHDRRYAINCEKIKKELNWKPSVSFDVGLKNTIKWYIKNQEWVNNVRRGEYKKWIEKNYISRDSDLKKK